MSTVPAVIDALIAGLRARPALSDVLISDGLPALDFSGRRLLTVGGQDEDTAEGTLEPSGMGGDCWLEDYVVRLYASAAVGGTDQHTARASAVAMYKDVAAWLRADPSLGGLLSGEGASVTEWRLRMTGPSTGDEGRWAECRFDVRIRTEV